MNDDELSGIDSVSVWTEINDWTGRVSYESAREPIDVECEIVEPERIALEAAQ